MREVPYKETGFRHPHILYLHNSVGKVLTLLVPLNGGNFQLLQYDSDDIKDFLHTSKIYCKLPDIRKHMEIELFELDDVESVLVIDSI